MSGYHGDTALDPHVADCGVNPGPGGLKTVTDVHAQNPRRMEKKGSWHGHAPKGVISHIPSYCLLCF